MSGGTHLTVTVRERAAQAAINGMSISTVAAAYGVDRKTVSRWVSKYSDCGRAALHRKAGGGRPRKLDELTEDELSSMVLKGAIAFGFETDLWMVSGLRSNHTGIECSNCRKTVDPRKCRVRDHYECLYCHTHIKLSADFFEQWLLFFGDQTSETLVTDFNPLRYVYVQCENCRNLHQYFRDADSPLPCPSCGHQQSLPSIRGVPISRAALASTGRLFEFRFTDGRSKLFLFPSKRKWMIGSSPTCAIALQNQPINAQHCVLKNTFEGPYILPADPAAQISVNGKSIAIPTLLNPGDEIQLGGVRLSLHGTPERQLRKDLSGLLNDIAERQKLVGELEFAEPAAKILQYYWELQRLRWIEYQRAQRTTLTNRIPLIQPGHS